jgi:serine/threonine-protein kinase HipA
MSTTPSEPDHAFVWVWLPGRGEPVVAGRLDRAGEIISFSYGQKYLACRDAIALYLPELPLQRGSLAPLAGQIAGCIADAAPDSWGQRVILNQRIGAGAPETSDLGILSYLLASGSDRTGALDFQTSSTLYVARHTEEATLAELAESTELVDRGVPLPPALSRALLHGSSLGGARPKALIREGGRQLIAKFSRASDRYPLEKGEFVAMTLAHLAGLDAAKVALTRALDRDVLLIDRFDRTPDGGRRAMVSALTILGLDEVAAGYASYADLAHTIRARFTDPITTLRELFARITFNILCSNTDDHARNHAAFWDGAELTLTPAYDVCPQSRVGGETAQLMAIGEDGYRMSQLTGCVARASTYRLSEVQAREIIDHQIETIEQHWSAVCDRAKLSEVERTAFWQRQFLNPYATAGYRGMA